MLHKQLCVIIYHILLYYVVIKVKHHLAFDVIYTNMAANSTQKRYKKMEIAVCFFCRRLQLKKV